MNLELSPLNITDLPAEVLEEISISMRGLPFWPDQYHLFELQVSCESLFTHPCLRKMAEHRP
jgi:hypothetical protein